MAYALLKPSCIPEKISIPSSGCNSSISGLSLPSISNYSTSSTGNLFDSSSPSSAGNFPGSSSPSSANISREVKAVSQWEQPIKKGGEIKETTVLNEIVETFSGEKKRCSKKRINMKQGRSKEIIEQVKRKHNMTNIYINEISIRQCIKCNRNFVINTKGGVFSPSRDVAEVFVEFIIKLAGIHASLNNSEGFALINSLIVESSEFKERDIQWGKHSHVKHNSAHARLGVGYWKGFKACWGDRIVSKKGHKYALQRSEWTTY